MTTTLYRYRTPPIRGSAWSFELALVSQADTTAFQINPTLAAGDVTVNIDGASFDNIDTLPTAIDSGAVITVVLSVAEMTAERVVVLFQDAAGDEWCDALVEIYTVEAATVSDFDDTSDTVTMGAMTAGGAQDFFTVDSTDLFADAVAGSVVKEIADHATIVASSITAAELTEALSGSTLTIHRGDTLDQDFTVASNTGYVTIDLTVKQDKTTDDSAAILKIRLNAPSASDGLLYLNGAAPVAPVVSTDGTITVNSATSITVALAARATDDLVPQDGLYYDIQYVFATSVQTVTEGICNITADVTRSIA